MNNQLITHPQKNIAMSIISFTEKMKKKLKLFDIRLDPDCDNFFRIRIEMKRIRNTDFFYHLNEKKGNFYLIYIQYTSSRKRIPEAKKT